MLKENDRISGGNIFEGIVSVRTLIANSLAFAAGNSGNDRKINAFSATPEEPEKAANTHG